MAATPKFITEVIFMMKKRIISTILSTAVLGSAFSSLSAFAEDTVINYKQMTINEAIDIISGEGYIPFRSDLQNSLSNIGALGSTMNTLDKSGKIHIIGISSKSTEIKMKKGTELPLDEMRSKIEENGMVMPVFRQRGDNFDLISGYDEAVYDFTMNLVKECEDVLSIENHYIVYEDTANIAGCREIIYSGEMSTEEFHEKYPEFKVSDKSAEYQFKYKNYTYISFSDDDEMRKILETLIENDEDYFSLCEQTELWADYKTIPCNLPILKNGTTGDANTDGKLGVSDAVMVLQYLANSNKYGTKSLNGISAQGIKNADMDENGLTGADALAIQKKAVEIGETPEPDNDSLTDIVDYDDEPVIAEFMWLDEGDERSWTRYTGTTLNRNKVGEKIAEKYLKDAEGNLSEKTADVYAINDVSSDYAVAVNYGNSRNYRVFVNWSYIPETVGEYNDSLNLHEELSFFKVHCQYAGEYEKTEFYGDKDII